MAQILIIDDEIIIQELLQEEFSRAGHQTDVAGTISEGIAKVNSNYFDIVFLDLKLPDGNGLNILSELRANKGTPEIIIMTGFGDPDGAEIAIKSGVWDYLEKPILLNDFNLTLQRALRFREQSQSRPSISILDQTGIIGESPQLKACYELAAKSAQTDANALITGETGTGKELFAQLVHRNSPRANQPFIVVDCASLPENLIESMLFGHERGAFTSADKSKPGLLRQAHQGTLFLDEIGELPLSMQKNLLRVLQERKFRPVGSIAEIESDFRLIAATNRNLETMVDQNTFRQDLLYRLKTFKIELPPLRERSGDIKILAIYFANQLCKRFNITEKGFSQDFFQCIETYNWPGNVRELSNTIEFVISQALDEPILFGKHLPAEIRIDSIKSKLIQTEYKEKRNNEITPSLEALTSTNNLPKFKTFRNQAIEKVEKNYFIQLLDKADGDFKKALNISGLARTRLYELLKKYHLNLKKGSSGEDEFL